MATKKVVDTKKNLMKNRLVSKKLKNGKSSKKSKNGKKRRTMKTKKMKQEMKGGFFRSPFTKRNDELRDKQVKILTDIINSNEGQGDIQIEVADNKLKGLNKINKP